MKAAYLHLSKQFGWLFPSFLLYFIVYASAEIVAIFVFGSRPGSVDVVYISFVPYSILMFIIIRLLSRGRTRPVPATNNSSAIMSEREKSQSKYITYRMLMWVGIGFLIGGALFFWGIVPVGYAMIIVVMFSGIQMSLEFRKLAANA